SLRSVFYLIRGRSSNALRQESLISDCAHQAAAHREYRHVVTRRASDPSPPQCRPLEQSSGALRLKGSRAEGWWWARSLTGSHSRTERWLAA
ncbi:unnamed protein product, partial [Mycena citricolor]